MPKFWFGFVALAGAAWAGQSPAPAEVTVCIHSQAVITPGAIIRARQVAKEIFDAIGVNLAWCGEVTGREEGVLVKVVVESRPDENSDELGEASPYARSHEITINYAAIKRASGIATQLGPLILGHVLAHEIAHILQGVSRHSATGVMKARWTPEDYCNMEWKPLEFAPEDVALIRLGLEALSHHNGIIP